MKKITKILSFCLGVLFLFVVGCSKKTEATTNKKTNKTTNQTTATNTTRNSSTTKKSSTKKTTTQAKTTVDDKRTTLIDLFDRDGDYISASISYVENGETKVATEDTYIEDGTPIDITISFIGDYAINIYDGDDGVTTNYLIYSGELIFIGEHDDPEPETFTISNYVPQSQAVKITYRTLDSYTIDYDRLVYDVVMTFNGTDYSSSTRRSIVEGDKVNVTIKNNNSDKRILFEIYEYDDNEEPTKLVEEHIIGKSGSYTMDEFQLFDDYYFKVTEYVAYAVDLYEIAEDDNLTYSFKAILNGVEKDIVSNNEYLGGSKIAITINNNTNQAMVLKITDEWVHKLYVKTISKNSTFIMPESEIITLDRNIRIYTELVVTHSVTLSSSPEGVSYALNDNDGIGYEFGDNVREGYLIITIYNNTNYQVYAVAYKNVNDGVDNILLDPNETNSMYIEEFNCDLHIVAESCPDGKKFNITFEGSSSFKYALYDPYTSEKIDTTNGLDFWKEVNLEVSTLGLPEDYIVKVYDYRNVVKAVALFNYFYEDEGEYLAFASFYIESDIRVVVEDRMDRRVIQAGYGFAHAGATYSATNEYGEPLEFEGRYLFVDDGQKINITISSPYCKLEVWGYYVDGEDEVGVIPFQTISKGSTKTFTITVTHDFSIDGSQAH